MNTNMNKFLKFLFFDVIETLFISAAIFVFVYIFVASPHIVYGDSMESTYVSGEFIMINEFQYRFENPKRGDVIVFQTSTVPFIKRVIGLPGDRIELVNGNVFLNGELLNESAYINAGSVTEGMDFLPNNKTITVPKNEYFVMGDNRNVSSDSREWGFVKKSQIFGRVFVVYWPSNDFHFVRSVKYINEGNKIVAEKI